MKRLAVITTLAVGLAFAALSFIKPRNTISLNNNEPGDTFCFFIMADPHYMTKKVHDKGEAFNNFIKSGDKLIQYSGELLDAFKEDIIKNRPDFVVVAGDLTCSGMKECHLDLAKKFKEIEKLGTRLYVVPGNHDILNPNAAYFFKDKTIRGESVTKKEFAQIYEDFGYSEAISRDKESLSYLIKPAEDKWLLMIDSTRDYHDDGGRIKASTLEWIVECSGIADENNAEIIAVMHHSIMDHSKIINKNYTVENSEEVLDVFQKCGIHIVLTGHIHLQDIKTLDFDDNILYDIATGSMVVYPHQYGEMRYLKNEGYEYRTVKIDVQGYAHNNKIKDEALVNFEKYSEDFFKLNCCSGQKNCIEDLEGISNEDKKELLKVVSEINKRYFAGYRNEALNDLVETDSFKLLESLPPCNIRNYIMSIINDERADNNTLFIPIAGKDNS